MPQRASATLAAILVLGLAAPAQARSAAALLQQGNTLFAKAEYQQALEVFTKAYQHGQQAVFLRSMAFCAIKLYQHERARGYLREYLRKFPKAPDFAELERLERTLDVVIQTRLEINSDPPGASIYIDAEVAGKVGITPMTLTIARFLRIPRRLTTG